MIDFGLLASMIIALGLPSLLCATRWPLRSFPEPIGFFDVALVPAVFGVVVGRLTAVAIDDPGGLTRFGDLLIIRSGVEFWAGLLAALVAVAWGARGETTLVARLADLAPAAMVGYAAYEMTCVLRDGCFGPVSAFGLRPPGLTTSMVPVGIIVGLVVIACAVGIRYLDERWNDQGLVVATAALAVAGVRAIASIWLPHVGDGLTRPHRTSIVVSVVALIVVALLGVRERQRSGAVTS